jgi:hypothetical protein
MLTQNSQALLIGLMFLKNQVVYIQFHPVVYMVKLNIEMSMASLVVRLAQGKPENDMFPEEFHSSTNKTPHGRADLSGNHSQRVHIQSIQLKQKQGGTHALSKIDSEESLRGIHCQTELDVTVERVESKKEAGSSRSSHDAPHSMFGDDIPLHKDNGTQVHARAL